MLKRTMMAAATAFIAINLWTGAPLFALWVGSQVVGKSALSMQAVFVVVIVLAMLLFAMVIALTWLNATYDELIAANYTVEEIRLKTGADSLGYLSIEGLVACVGGQRSEMCLGCFVGEYPNVPAAHRLAAART